MNTLLAIDLSTACTGWSLFDLDTGALLEYGSIKPELPKGHTKWHNTKRALYTINSMAEKVVAMIVEKMPKKILIEQINRGINRISQKTLDGVHWMVLEGLRKQSVDFLDIVQFVDTIQWRGKLNLKLTAEEKKHNAAVRRKKDKKSVINFKTLSVRFVNKEFNKTFTEKDNDVTDAICLGFSYFK